MREYSKAIFAALVIVAMSACDKPDAVTEVPKPAPAVGAVAPTATYVGAKSCSSCHSAETDEWHTSDHHKAMEIANEETVLGNFDNALFTHFGVETRFTKKDGNFFVETQNENGEPTTYKVDYTFGHYPLQQYLIPFPGGRFQALTVCWDSRPKEKGGQRWFHLYQDEKIPAGDELHWTGPNFNWNYMCADCHSTDLKKNYDVEKDAYNTTWSEMNVSCESCHGPGSEHVEWAGLWKDGKADPKDDLKKGLVVYLKERQAAAFAPDPVTGQPKRTLPLESTVQVETCARCHSHRRPLQDEFIAGQHFADTHRPAILEDHLYHPDGQIQEEVYVYGSFVQSKMFHNGVRCTDCHNPHTLKLRAEGNMLCAQCHQPAKYDAPTHHHHQTGSTGAVCVDCHMPVKHYMVVDPRRDHSIRIPRPDLSVKLGTPNACNNCHKDQTSEWSAKALLDWLKLDGKPPLPAHYGEVIAARNEKPLIDLAADLKAPGIVRATAVHLLGNQPSQPSQPSQASIQATVTALDDPDPAVRESALTGLEPLDPRQRVDLAGKLLRDPIRSVRIEAARVLAPDVPLGLLKGPDFDRALQEYKDSLNALADRGGSHMGLGLLYTSLGDPAAAEKAYRTAFRVEPSHVESRINLAELMFQQGRVAEAQEQLEAAVRIQPTRGAAHEALGRHWVRVKEYEKAMASIAEAVRLMPDNPHIHYFYGVALNQLGRFDQALPVLKKAHELEPRNAEYLIGLATICRDSQKWDLALEYAEKLKALNPSNPEYEQLYRAIGAQALQR